MNPQTAIHDPIFQFYTALIGGTFALAGLTLLALTYLARKDMSSVWRIYRGWLIIIPVAIGAVFLGRIPTILLFSLVALFGFKEFARATGLYNDWWMTGVVYLAIIGIAALAIFPDPFNGRAGWFGMFRTVPVYAVTAILIVPILRDRVQGQLQTISLALLGFLYMGWMLSHLAFFANSNHPYAYLLYLMLAVELNDVAAYICGRLFGRSKFRPNISPNKTWAGAIGALAFSMTLPWILGFTFPHFGPIQKILTGIIVGVGGQLGDLSISIIKRDLGIKDMGAVLPGHGGLLDRVDSLIYTAPLFFHMINWFYGIYGVR